MKPGSEYEFTLFDVEARSTERRRSGRRAEATGMAIRDIPRDSDETSTAMLYGVTQH